MTFRACLSLGSSKIARTNNNGYSKRPCYRIQFSDVQFYNWLVTVGLKPAKTHCLEALRIPDECFRDFLRGHLDGDGSIITYTDHYNVRKNPKYVYTRVWVRFCSASRSHIEWIRATTGRLWRVRGHLNRTRSRQPESMSDMWFLKFGKKESVQIMRWIYYDPSVPCLQRKKRIAEKFIGRTGAVGL